MSAPHRRIEFTVIGIPQPQGSAKAYIRGAHVAITHDNPKLRGWRQLVAEQAQSIASNGMFLGPVVLTVTFRLPRLPSIPKRRVYPTVAPDLDKLVRAIGDGLTGVVILDDKQIVALHARKIYTSGTQPPSAHIVIEAAVLTEYAMADDLFGALA
jgi:crossover junction endodeoxyribonuclease RusA